MPSPAAISAEPAIQQVDCLACAPVDRVADICPGGRGAFGLDEDLRLAAVDVVLDGLLGEARRLQHIGTVDVVKDLGPDLEEGAGEIEDLKPHLDQLVTEGPREESE